MKVKFMVSEYLLRQQLYIPDEATILHVEKIHAIDAFEFVVETGVGFETPEGMDPMKVMPLVTRTDTGEKETKFDYRWDWNFSGGEK